MNNTSNVRVMVETALMAALAVIMVFLSLNPFLSFIGLFTAVPIMVLTARQGIKPGLSGSVVFGLVLFILLDPVTAASNLVMFGFAAVAAGYMLRAKLSATQTILVSALIFAVGVSVLIVGAMKITGTDPFASVNQVFDETKAMVVKEAKIVNLSQADLDEQLKLYDTLKATFQNVKPGIIIVSGGFFAITNYFLARIIAHRSGVPIKDMSKFRDHKMPSSLGPGVLLILAMTFVAGQLNYIDAGVVFLNLKFIFFWVFLIQGISVMVYLVHRTPKNQPLKAIVYIMLTIFFLPFGSLDFIAILGLIDAIMDIRKLYESRQA